MPLYSVFQHKRAIRCWLNTNGILYCRITMNTQPLNLKWLYIYFFFFFILLCCQAQFNLAISVVIELCQPYFPLLQPASHPAPSQPPGSKPPTRPMPPIYTSGIVVKEEEINNTCFLTLVGLVKGSQKVNVRSTSNFFFRWSSN